MIMDSTETNSPEVSVEQENISDRSEKCFSFLSLFQLHEMLLHIFMVNIHVKIDGTTRNFVGFLAVLNELALKTFCYPLIVKQAKGYVLKIKEKHVLETIQKSLFSKIVEKDNGTPIPPQQETNIPLSCVNKNTLSSILKVAMGANMTGEKAFFFKRAVIMTFFTNLRPILVGPNETMPRLDMADIFSFLRWPSCLPITAMDLYKRGFHCLDHARQRVQCLSCGKILEVYQDSLIEVCCPLKRVLNFDGPVCAKTAETYMQSVARWLSHSTSFHLQPRMENCLEEQYLDSSAVADVNQMVKAGFYPSGNYGVYRCYSCGLHLGNWHEGQDPILRHAAVSLYCQHILNTCGPVFIHLLRQSLLKAGMALPGYIGRHFIHHFDFRFKNVRAQTWSNSPLASLNEGRKWSDAGFFLNNQHWAVCFCCGISLYNIRENDEPFDVHFKSHSSCPFLLETRPKYFDIRAGNHEPLTKEQVRQFAEPTGDHHETGATSGLRLKVQGVLDGTDTFHETESIRYLFADQPQDQTSEDVLGADELKRMKEENTAMKTMLLCIVCETRERAVVFLQCGHLICCAECASANRKCPLCQATIEGTVKTTMS